MTIGGTREVGGVVEEMDAARRADALRLVQEAAVAEHDGRRDGARAHELLRPVQVGQHAVQQLGALRDAGLDGVPLRRRQQQGQRVHLPGPIGALGVGVHVVRDAVLADLALHQRQRVGHLGALAGGEAAQEGVPVRPRLAGRRQELVVAAFEGGVAGEELSQHAGIVEAGFTSDNSAKPYGCADVLRRSSVNGKSGLRSSFGTFIAPGVWPMRKKRARRRASAS